MSAAPAAAVYHSPDDVPADQVDSLLASLHASYSAAGQSHVFDFVPSLSAGEKKSLYFDLQHIQVEKVAKDFEEVLKQESAASQATPASITPFLNVSDLSSSTEEQKTAWRDLGLDLIAQGKVAAVLMAGGQGTRLGSSEPKGCYDIQLLSHKSLFQLQAERISRLRQIAADHVKVDVEKVHLRWYVMVSPSAYCVAGDS